MQFRSSPKLLCAFVLLLAGCRGKVLASVDLQPSGSGALKLPAGETKLSLWADTDGSWRDTKQMPVLFDFDVLSAGKSVAHFTCDTKDPSESVCGVAVSNGNEHSGDCEMKMRCELPALPADATLQVVGRAGPGVRAVKKLVLNVRKG
jgi:hypothetical protein